MDVRLAAWPWWLTMMIVFAFMGPLFRMGRHWGGWGDAGSPRSRKGLREELARMDAALAERDEVIDDLQRRLLEVESRLDFTERLLAEKRDQAALPAG